MIAYEQIKTWLRDKDNKHKIVLGACFILVFIIGFGTGKYREDKGGRPQRMPDNYNTSAGKQPTGGKVLDAVTGKPQTAQNKTTAGNCIIKGNVSASGKKIYHIAGGAFYKIVKPEQCFKTESEAVAAGFKKSSR